jgi:RimJ/RimL family protein N-acetyltransferase
MIEAARVRLRPWREPDRSPLAAMHTDEEVMADYGGPLTRAESDAKLERYATAFGRHGFSRLALETLDGGFLGYVGVMPIMPDHPAAPGVEIGWRLVRSAWGAGFASEGARAALHDGFKRFGWDEVLSYTAPDNLRSQAVMGRLGLAREPGRDFVAGYDTVAAWTGLVWVARPYMDFG